MTNKQEIAAQLTSLKTNLERFVFSVVKNSDDTADIVQNTLLKAFIRIEMLKNDDKLTQWVYSIARNEINAHFNALKRRTQPLPETEVEENPMNEHFENCMGTFIDDLPQKYSEAVRLAHIENLSQKDLAQQLNISYSGAKSRVQRGREKLKELITDCCTIQHDSYGNIVDYHPNKGGYCAKCP